MSRRALAWTGGVGFLLVALGAVFAAAGWRWPLYVGFVVSILVFAWVVYEQGAIARYDGIGDDGPHAVDEEHWVATVIAEMERHLASGETGEDLAPSAGRDDALPDAAPIRHRGVLARMLDRVRRIDWSDDRGGRWTATRGRAA